MSTAREPSAAGSRSTAPVKTTTTTTTTTPPPPLRQIRAWQDDASDTVVVYQAYQRGIADPAVAAQKLHASPLFRHARTTWVKPSWAWMLYRAGYSYKDAGQERILALRMRRRDFVRLLEKGVLTTHGAAAAAAGGGRERGGDGVGAEKKKEEDKGEDRRQKIIEGPPPPAAGKRRKHRDPEKPRSPDVKIQWDPERSLRLERLEYRSIQIGIPPAVSPQWTEEWIVGIEDVTAKAQELKRILDEEPGISEEELRGRGLAPVETPFELPEHVKARLGM